MTSDQLRAFCLGAVFVAIILVSLKALGERRAAQVCPADEESPTLWSV